MVESGAATTVDQRSERVATEKQSTTERRHVTVGLTG